MKQWSLCPRFVDNSTEAMIFKYLFQMTESVKNYLEFGGVRKELACSFIRDKPRSLQMDIKLPVKFPKGQIIQLYSCPLNKMWIYFFQAEKRLYKPLFSLSVSNQPQNGKCFLFSGSWWEMYSSAATRDTG